jgi:hypothetical protein
VLGRKDLHPGFSPVPGHLKEVRLIKAAEKVEIDRSDDGTPLDANEKKGIETGLRTGGEKNDQPDLLTAVEMIIGVLPQTGLEKLLRHCPPLLKRRIVPLPFVPLQDLPALGRELGGVGRAKLPLFNTTKHRLRGAFQRLKHLRGAGNDGSFLTPQGRSKKENDHKRKKKPHESGQPLRFLDKESKFR